MAAGLILTEDADLYVVSGPADAAAVPAFRAALIDVADRGPSTVVVDLSTCSDLDATGAAALVGAVRRLARRGACLKLTGVDEPVRQALARYGLRRYFQVAAGL